ncbi:MAG: TonB-dependent receptor [Pseudomonadota bacterium]
MNRKRIIGCVVGVFALLTWALPGMALETSSAIRGVVSDPAGNPLSNVRVVVRNENTSLTRETQTNEAGEFGIRNLQVGEDYTVVATASGRESSRLEDVQLSLGRVASVSLVMSPATMEEVVVTATRITSQVAVGPSATFGLRELETAPAINRNISDVLRIDPRIYVDESRGDINAIQCGGKNSRFNSLTVDGVRTNDSFGLNSNGFPTERMPFSYDAINEVSVELAPFDASYGGFTACNINAVTKSGGNEFFGSVFYDYTDDDLRNDSLEGDDIESGGYDENRWGVTLGGPIIKDRLFFFGAYEKLEGANLFDRGPIGSGAVNEVLVSQAEIDEILQIARDIYQYDPGAIPSSADNEDEKLLVKLDWYINDQHRVAFTYNYNDGFNIVESDGDLDEFEFANHLYERGSELNSYVGTLYSDWTDTFSTQIRLGRLELDNRQISQGGGDFGEIRVELDDVDVYLGGDDSRQSNQLNYEVDTLSLTGTYLLGEHTLSFGYEREALEVFNLFVQHTETEIRFSGIDNFRDGFARAIYYNNAPSNNPTDAAADWGYEVNTLFVQDEFYATDRLELLVGLRYDWYTTDDEPEANPDFVADYGFSNSTSLDGEGLLQPRLGFTYTHSDQLTVRGGIGLYSGGDPNVWLSNNFSNNNVLQFGQRGRSFGYTDGSRSLFDADVVYLGLEPGVPAGPGYGIPSELFNAVAGGTGDNFEINYLDPDFELPSEWKFAVGFTYDFENDYTLSADLLVTRAQDTAIILRGDLERVGTTVDGYPDYDSVREPTFVLTNSRKGNESEVLSFSISKFYDNGIDWRAGYSYTNAEDVQPMTSSVAFSNYQNRAFFDPQEQVLSTSNYEIKHRFTAMFNMERTFFGDNVTRLSVYAHANQGPSFSYAFNGTINPYGFTPFLDFRNNVLEPGDDRNDQDGSWWSKVDIRVEQEFNVGNFGKASAFLVIDNFTNLLNDEWGVLREVNFPNNVERGDQEEARVGDASRYEIRFGVRYTFNQ